MLPMAIVEYLMRQEGVLHTDFGGNVGFAVSHLQKRYNVNKSTFYRALNALIKSNIVIKFGRGSYVLSQSFRHDCNMMVPSKFFEGIIQK